MAALSGMTASRYGPATDLFIAWRQKSSRNTRRSDDLLDGRHALRGRRLEVAIQCVPRH